MLDLVSLLTSQVWKELRILTQQSDQVPAKKKSRADT